MSMTTCAKAVMSGAVTGLALLGVTAIPAFAHNQKQSATLTASETTVTQAQATPTEVQGNQRMETMQQMSQIMEQCNSMMSMMQGMMDNGNMPGMMNGQPSQPGQGMMNRTTGQ